MKFASSVFPALIFFSFVRAQTVAIVRDGTPDWYADAQVSGFQEELADLREGEPPVTYIEYDGHWSSQGVKQALDAALENPEVDVVYTAGFVSSIMAQDLTTEQRIKPVFAGGVRYSAVADYPINEQGTSKVPNFAFVASPQRVESDLQLLEHLTDTEKIYVLVDDFLWRNLRQAETMVTQFEAGLNVDLEMISVKDPSATRFLEALPPEARAVYVSITGRMNAHEREALYDGLMKRDIVSMAMVGERELELGAMVALAPDIRETISRRIAVGLLQLLEGLSTDNLLVYLPVEDRLMLNMRVAREIGWTPSYDILLEAGQISPEILEPGEEISLERAMLLADTESVEPQIFRAQFEAQQARERTVAAKLGPALDVQSDLRYQEVDDPLQPITPEQSTAASYGLELRQVIWNDNLRSARSSASRQTLAAEKEYRTALLDAQERAGVAYLEMVKQLELYQIRQEDLRLTENNLRLAKLRRSIGAASDSEVYRWDSNAAQARAAVFQQDAAYREAVAAFNRVLGFSQDKIWSPESITLSVDDFYFLDEELDDLKTDNRNFRAFRSYLIQQAVSSSQELSRLDDLIKAQQIQATQSGRSRFMPEIAGVASWIRNDLDTEMAPRNSETLWFVGLTASIPLYAGSGIDAEEDLAHAELRKLILRRTLLKDELERQAVSTWNQMRGLHPTIRLTRRSREAARKTYESVRNKYSAGAATILDLLDAQSQLLQQERQSVIALYEYLSNMIRLQRVISWFEMDHSPEERQAWADAFLQFLEQQYPENP